jgi:Fur family ferric uptake transcriptional regulator
MMRTILAATGRVAARRPTMTHADELKSSGLKATLPRIKILEVFQRPSSAT